MRKNNSMERDSEEQLSEETTNFVETYYGYIGPDGCEYVSIEEYYEIHEEG